MYDELLFVDDLYLKYNTRMKRDYESIPEKIEQSCLFGPCDYNLSRKFDRYYIDTK